MAGQVVTQNNHLFFSLSLFVVFNKIKNLHRYPEFVTQDQFCKNCKMFHYTYSFWIGACLWQYIACIVRSFRLNISCGSCKTSKQHHYFFNSYKMIYTGKNGFFRMGVTLIFIAIVGGIAFYLDDHWPNFLFLGKFPLWQCFLFLVGLWLTFDLLRILLGLCVYLIASLFKLIHLRNMHDWLSVVGDKIFPSK